MIWLYNMDVFVLFFGRSVNVFDKKVPSGTNDYFLAKLVESLNFIGITFGLLAFCQTLD